MAAAVVRMQAASAMAAARKALQQGSAFPHGASRVVRSWPCVLTDACLIALIGLPVDEARMMVRDEYLPFGARQVSNTLAPRAGGIQHRLGARLAIGIGAGIDGIGQHMVDGRVIALQNRASKLAR